MWPAARQSRNWPHRISQWKMWLVPWTECKCLEWWSTKLTTNMVKNNNTKCRQVKDSSINGRCRLCWPSIFNLTTSCVVFVHHVGGHFGDHLDHHSKHLHSVHGTSHIFHCKIRCGQFRDCPAAGHALIDNISHSTLYQNKGGGPEGMVRNLTKVRKKTISRLATLTLWKASARVTWWRRGCRILPAIYRSGKWNRAVGVSHPPPRIRTTAPDNPTPE